MRIVTNEAFIARNRKITNILTFTSLGALALGFFYSFSAPQAMSNILCLALPFLMLLTLTSTRMTNRWVREPRPEKVLDESLKGLGQKYTLFHYLLPAHHVLIGPEGVFVLYTVWQNRPYKVKGAKWLGENNLFVRLGGWLRQDLLGNPFYNARHDAQQVQNLVDKIAPDSGVEVQPLIVFIHPNASFEAEDPTYPVLYADPKKKPSLRGYLREIKAGSRPTLTLEQLDEIDRIYGLVTRQELAAEGLEADVEDEESEGEETVSKEKGQPGTIYIFQAGQLYNIGLTRHSLTEKQEELQKQTDQPVELVHSFVADDPETVILRLHKKYNRKRQKGEWFGLSRKDIAALKAFKGTAGRDSETAEAETESSESEEV